MAYSFNNTRQAAMNKFIFLNLITPLLYALLKLNVKAAYKRIYDLNNLSNEDLLNHKFRRLSEYYSEVAVDDSLKTEDKISFLLGSLKVKTKSDYQKFEFSSDVKKSLISRETSGTTGTPLKFFYSKATIAHQLAVRKYCLSLFGIELGEKEARFWGRKEDSFKSNIKNMILNRKIFNFLSQPEKQLQALIQYQPSYIYGYSSLILNAAQVIEATNIKPPKLKLIVCTAEVLSPFQVKYISDVFSCPVVMEYGCTEFDIIGFQCELGQYHQVNPDLLLEADEGGCLVTDLNNEVMNLHRYRLGDALSITKEPCLCHSNLPMIEDIKGRTSSQLVTLPTGKKVHAVVFPHMIEDLEHAGYQISNFMVTQRALDEFELDIELRAGAAEIDSDELTEKLNIMFIERLESNLRLTLSLKKIKLEEGKKFIYFESLVSKT